MMSAQCKIVQSCDIPQHRAGSSCRLYIKCFSLGTVRFFFFFLRGTSCSSVVMLVCVDNFFSHPCFTMSANLGIRQIRQVYLITYSKAQPNIAATRKEFADKVVNAFNVCGTATILHWACSLEYHFNGAIHFHMCIKLNKTQRWLNIRNYLCQHYEMNVNFSSVHHNYYSAWKYVIKEDLEFLQSESHPDLNLPVTDVASETVTRPSQSNVHSQPMSANPHPEGQRSDKKVTIRGRRGSGRGRGRNRLTPL